MVYDRDDETDWLLRVRNNSRERIHSARMGFGITPPLAQQKMEARANFSVMKTIARKRNPKVVPLLNQLEQLCIGSLNGTVSDKQFINGCRKVAKNAKVSDPVVDFLDDLVLNQSDIHPSRNLSHKPAKPLDIPNPLANMKNPYFDEINQKKKKKRPVDVFGDNPAYNYGGKKVPFGLDIKNPAFDKNFGKKSNKNNSGLVEPKNPFLDLKNPYLASKNKQPILRKVGVSSGKGSVKNFDPWSLQNPAFSDLKKSNRKGGS